MIILQCNMSLGGEQFENLYKSMDKMRKNGLIVLPPGIEVVHISEKEKAKIICEDDVALEFPNKELDGTRCADCVNAKKNYPMCKTMRELEYTFACDMFEEKEKKEDE